MATSDRGWSVRGQWAIPLGLLLAAGPLAAAEPPVGAETVEYRILITGGELLDGAYPDGHTYFLTRTLRPLGLHCTGSSIVDDRPGDIEEALRAGGKVKLVIVTGGLGPTDNDVTRQSLSRFTGIALREDPKALAELEQRFKTPRDQLRPNLRRQVRVPERGGYLKNRNGTAVGLIFETPERTIVALPGPPRELQPMVREELVPYLGRRFGTRRPGASITLRFVGLGQSQIDHAMKQHLAVPADVITGSQFEGSRVDFSFALPGDTPQDRARLEELKRKILRVEELADCVYADDPVVTLEDRVEKLLQDRGASVALAEVGSGGALAVSMGDSKSAARVLAGATMAPTGEKLRRLLRVPDDRWNAAASTLRRLELVAAAAAESAGSSWAIAVGEVREDQPGSRAVEVVFRHPDGSMESQRLTLRGSGELARANLATQLIDHFWRHLR